MPDRDRAVDRESELLRVLTVETREELVKADGKAGLVLSGLGAVLAALLGGLATGDVAPRHYPPLPQGLFWTGCVAWIPAFLLLGLAMAPRPGRPRPLRAHYFGDVSGAPSTGLLAAVIQRTDIKDRDLHQLLRLSRIVLIKYRCVRYGMLWAAVFVVLTAAGLLVGTSS